MIGGEGLPERKRLLRAACVHGMGLDTFVFRSHSWCLFGYLCKSEFAAVRRDATAHQHVTFFFSRHHGARRCKDSLIFISLSCSTRTVAIFFLNDFCSGIPQVEGFFWRTGKYCLWWCSFLAFFARTTKLQTYRDLAQWLCLGLVDPCRPRKIRKRTPWRFCQDEDPGTSQPLMFGPWHCCC